MADYIRREEAMEIVKRTSGDYAAAFVEIRRLPAADVKPTVHGRWIDHMVRDWCCSECGEEIDKVRKVDGYCYDDKPNYCPNCGAKMDGDAK